MDFGLLYSESLFKWIQNISLHWEVPIFSSFIYVVWVLRNNKRIREKKEKKEILEPQGENRSVQKKAKGKSMQLKCLIFLHNMGMSIFSMLVFKKTFEPVYEGFSTLSFDDFIADSKGEMEKKLAPWFWLFYISKYYEVIDTLILFVTQKESSFLQMYHHAGAIVGCWLVSLGQSYIGWIWVGLNSFIHSTMYLYYAMTVLGIRPPFKRLITFMQISQFFVGIFFGVIYSSKPSTFSADPTIRMYQYAGIAYNMVYVIGLIGLFIHFERKTYRRAVAQPVLKKKQEKPAPVLSLPSTLPSSPSVASPVVSN